MGMMINRRRVCGTKDLLPSGYKQLEWIENTSDAYILLNYKVNNYTEYETITYYRGNSTVYLMGSRKDLNNSFFAITNVNLNRVGLVCPDNAHRISVMFETSPSVCKIKAGNGKLIANGVIGTYDNSTNFTSTNPLTLFRCATNSSGAAVGNFYALIGMGHTIIYENGVVLFNLIPCLSPDNKVGMYDTVTESFFKSPNGTAFVAGPDA